jgi:hypothetical protein
VDRLHLSVPPFPPGAPAGPGLLVLNGRHLLLALRRRAADFARDGLPVPEAYRNIVTTTIVADAPLRIRELAAGDMQAAQHAAVRVSVAEFAQLLLNDLERPGASASRTMRLAAAWVKTGWDASVAMV